MDSLLRHWNESYFDNQLPPAVLAIFDALGLSTQSETVKGVLERQFRAMKQTHFQATDFTDDFARNLYAVLNVFAKSWNGAPRRLRYQDATSRWTPMCAAILGGNARKAVRSWMWVVVFPHSPPWKRRRHCPSGA